MRREAVLFLLCFIAGYFTLGPFLFRLPLESVWPLGVGIGFGIALWRANPEA